jgi:SAM-dependent methyltransferase
VSDDPVACFAAGRISAEVALARLLLAGADVEARAASAPDLRAALARHRDRLRELRDMLAEVRHDAPASVESVAAMFDRAACRAPEASVALYSLGDPALLARATGELLAWVRRRGLLGPRARVLDLGCGIGRVAACLAPHVGSVLGIDVSAEMIGAARRRHAAGGAAAAALNLRFEVCGGRDLAGFDAGVFDLVLAVDSMPYLVQAGVAEAHVGDIARLLPPGGALVVVNLSYRGVEADRATARGWAARYGFSVEVDAETPFALWDGTAFVLRRTADATRAPPLAAEAIDPRNTASFSSAARAPSANARLPMNRLTVKPMPQRTEPP